MKKAVFMRMIVCAVIIIMMLGLAIGLSSCNDLLGGILETPETTTQNNENQSLTYCKHDDPTQIVNVDAVDPSCAKTGLTNGKKCNLCGTMVIPQEIDPVTNIHNYEKVVIAEPTITKNGVLKYTCATCGDTYTETMAPVNFTVTADNRAMIGYTGAEGENLVIPALFKHDGTWYKNTRIGYSAFEYCSNLTSITIPDSVTSIDSYAFSDCSSLTSITIPDSVTSIGYRAFYNCSSLTNITIPDSVTGIEFSVFSGCSSLTSITISNGVTSIKEFTFHDCSSLTSITIPNSVTSIGNYAFYGCSSLTNITIPDSVTSIGSQAFKRCINLTSITIPSGVTSVGYATFADCSSLTSVTIPNSVTNIGDWAFENCNSLTSITIPDSVTSIGEYAFYRCNSLTNITFQGTIEQWNVIEKATGWTLLSSITEIVCSDGIVKLN